MKIEELQTLEIPLSKLLAWNDNVRTTGVEEGIGELAASIASVGLLQGLVVKKEPRGKYAVIAGRRRLMALSQLADEGKVKATLQVPCRLASKDADLPEISLTENVMRVPMHPADEFEAFQRLIASGKSVPDVAARFGVTEAVVLRRIALARVSPMLLDAYRKGQLNLELLQAFTLTDDHSAQEGIWNQLHPWDRKAHMVRQMLSSDDIPATDKRVRFVGLPTYEAAGGTVRRDLFAEGESGTYIADPAKLTRLVSEKLTTLAETLRADGWKWVEVQPETDHQAISRYKRVHAPELPLSADANAEIESLEEQRDGLVTQLEHEEDEENKEAQTLYEQIDEIDRRIQAIRRNRKTAYSDQVKASSGVVISIGHNGEPAFVCGLLRKEDEIAMREPEEIDSASIPSAAPNPAPAQEPSACSAVLLEALTQYKTAAIAAELFQQPNIALAAMVHGLVLNEFGLDLHLYRSQTCLQVSTRQAHLEGANDSAAAAVLEEQKRSWLQRLAPASDDIWPWCLQQSQETLLQLLAYCVSRTIDAVKSKSDTNDDLGRLQQADALADALQFDMTKWFAPTADNFFSKVPKSRIAQALTEAGKPLTPEALKLKKVELATLAENEIRGTGWLPEALRIAKVTTGDTLGKLGMH
jgi:ParB family chromosome partitioning protein